MFECRLLNVGLVMMRVTENTNLLRKGKYHSTADLCLDSAALLIQSKQEVSRTVILPTYGECALQRTKLRK